MRSVLKSSKAGRVAYKVPAGQVFSMQWTGEKMKKKTRNYLLIAAGFVLLLIVLTVGAFFYYTSKLNIEVFDTEEDSGYFSMLKADKDDDGVTNILVIGADNDVGSGMDSPGNGDGLMILSVNNSKKQITLTSLMRDIRVVKSNGYATKLTLAYHDGGPELLIECIESNIGIDIDNYVRVNYHDVVKIIDAAGGVEMELYVDEIEKMQAKIEAVAKTVGADWEGNKIQDVRDGVHKLNGVQAAGFMRVRLAGDGDLERTSRARRVLTGIKDNMSKMNLVQLANFANVVLPCITTDMEQDDIAAHLVKLNKYLKYDLVSNRIPVDDSFHYSQDGHAYTVIKFDVNREHFYNLVYTEAQIAKLESEAASDSED